MFLKFTKLDVLVIVTFSFPIFLTGFVITMVIPVFPSLVGIMFGNSSGTDNSSAIQPDQYHYQKLSLLFSIKFVVQMIVSPVTGFFIELCGPKIALLIGTVLQLASVITYGLVSSYTWLMFGRVIDAFSCVLVHCAALSVVPYWFKDQRQQGFVYGVRAITYNVGLALGPPYAGFVYQYYGQKIVFIATVFVYIPATVFAILLIAIDDHRRKKKSKKDRTVFLEATDGREVEIMLNKTHCKEGPPLQNYQKYPQKLKEEYSNHNIFMFLKDPYFLVVLGFFPITLITFYLLISSIPRYMAVTFKASEWMQGIIWICNFIGYAVGFIVGNLFNNRFPRYRHILMMVCILVHGLGILSISFMPKWWSMVVPLSVVMHIYLVTEVVVSPIMAKIVHQRHFSKFGIMSGIMMLTISGVATLGSYLGPVLLKTIGLMNVTIGLFIMNVLYAPLCLSLKEVCL